MRGALINHLWQSTVFAATAGLLTLAFRGNRAQVRYGLWLCASLKFLAPFALLISLGSGIAWRPAVEKIAAAAVSLAVTQAAEPFPEMGSFARSDSPGRNWIPVLLLGLWAGGFAVVALTRARGWRRIRATVRASRMMDLQAAIEVRAAPGLLEPSVVGWRRPVLLLPAGITERLTSMQLEAVLAHEVCHARRRDNLTAALHMVVEAVFWFHPLVWWIGARLVEERERACDEAVLRLGGEAGAYAAGILEVCKSYLESPLRCVAGVTGSDLKKRIHEILSERAKADLSLSKKVALAVSGMAAVAAPLVVGMLHAPLIRAQIARADGPKFELASIRACKDGGRGNTKRGPAGGTPTTSPGRLNTGCATLAAPYPMAGLIQRVYGGLGLGRRLTLGAALPVEGGPSWIYSDSYVISAKAPGDANLETMEGPMLQALLEDRFRLKVHRETREVPVYALTVAKGGPRIQPVAKGSCTRLDPPVFPPPPLAPGQKYCRDLIGPKGPNVRLEADEVSLDAFGKLLGLAMDRPVIDRTGLRGKYDIHLEFANDQSTPGLSGTFGPAAGDPTAASIFTMVQEQLGLRLEAARGPREFLVIDHVERPSEN